VKTKGDEILDQSPSQIDGKGIFTKELEYALIKGEIDFAVHSMKDLPAEIPDQLTIAAVSKREDPRDVLITPDGKTVEELPPGAIIGTGSPRREVQILQIRPDLRIKSLRGNVLTRINKLLHSEFDGIILAAAGLIRLGNPHSQFRYFDIETMIPAVGQGILGLESRRNDPIIELLQNIHSVKSWICLSAERSFMAKLNGGCSAPIAAHAVISDSLAKLGDNLKISGFWASTDRQTVIRESLTGNIDEPAVLGEELAERILLHLTNNVSKI
jgi:hydroxymethylbilane synthase